MERVLLFKNQLPEPIAEQAVGRGTNAYEREPLVSRCQIPPFGAYKDAVDQSYYSQPLPSFRRRLGRGEVAAILGVLSFMRSAG